MKFISSRVLYLKPLLFPYRFVSEALKYGVLFFLSFPQVGILIFFVHFIIVIWIISVTNLCNIINEFIIYLWFFMIVTICTCQTVFFYFILPLLFLLPLFMCIWVTLFLLIVSEAMNQYSQWVLFIFELNLTFFLGTQSPLEALVYVII